MRRLLASLVLLFALGAPALAQQATTCPDVPTGDKSNRCANTRFVANNGGGGGTSALAHNKIFIGNASNVATASPMTGDCVISFSTGNAAIVCTKTNGVAFGAFATGTDAANLTGTVSAARGGFGINMSSCSGAALFTAGVAVCTSASGSGSFVLGTGPSISGGTITGAAVTGLPTPVVGSDAATKSYVDTAGTGLHVHPAVQLASTVALAANTYNNGASGVGATLTGNVNGSIGAIDGTTPSAGNRLLIKDEAAQANNGCYTATTIGDGSNPYVITRCTDSDTAAEMAGGDSFLALGGTLNVNTTWVNTTPVVTMGTTSIVFAQFAAGGGNTWTISGADIQNNNAGTVKIGTTMTMLGNVLLNGNWLSGDGGNEGVFVDSSGNVGVNTSSPSSYLTAAWRGLAVEVGGGATSNVRGLMVMAPTLSTGTALVYGLGVAASTNNLANVTFNYAGSGSSSNYMGFNLFGNTPPLTLGPTSVGIGTSAPTAQLHTTGTVRLAGVSGVGTAGCVAIAASGDLSRAGCGGGAIFYPTVTCNGVVDNTAAIQASLDAAAAAGPGGVVELPYGSCLSGTLTQGADVWLRGQWSGAAATPANGTTLLAKTGITNLINVTGYNARISYMTLVGNATSGWGINNNPGNTSGNSSNEPTLVTDVVINSFSQAGRGGIINSSGTIHVERSLFQNNCYGFYSFDANINGRFLKNNIQGGGGCGYQAIWTNNGASNEGNIIRDNLFLASAGQGVNIHSCVLCYFENNVIGSTTGANDFTVDAGRSVHMVGNYFDKPVVIASLTTSWFMRNSMPSSNALTVSGASTLIMFNAFSAACSFGGGVTALINTGGSGCNTTSSVPTSW